MTAQAAKHAQVESRLAALSRVPLGVDPADIAEVVESVLGSISGDKSGVNLKLHEDISALADFIRSAKADITALRADEISTKFIPAASDELSAIVGATETATNEIFEAVDTIEAASNGLAPEAAEPIAEAVTRIYEACGFQDITGQRITKIVKVLQEVEDKVASLLEAFGEEVPKTTTEGAGAAVAELAGGEDKAVESDEDLMNGPQLASNAMSQEEVDALMADFG